jgi:hypothetical protein
VARVVLGLVLCGGFGQEEGAPVREAADHAAGGEDLLASGAGDSEEGVGGQWAVERHGRDVGTGSRSVLSDLGQVARPDLGQISVLA